MFLVKLNYANKTKNSFYYFSGIVGLQLNSDTTFRSENTHMIRHILKLEVNKSRRDSRCKKIDHNCK